MTKGNLCDYVTHFNTEGIATTYYVFHLKHENVSNQRDSPEIILYAQNVISKIYMKKKSTYFAIGKFRKLLRIYLSVSRLNKDHGIN